MGQEGAHNTLVPAKKVIALKFATAWNGLCRHEQTIERPGAGAGAMNASRTRLHTGQWLRASGVTL